MTRSDNGMFRGWYGFKMMIDEWHFWKMLRLTNGRFGKWYIRKMAPLENSIFRKWYFRAVVLPKNVTLLNFTYINDSTTKLFSTNFLLNALSLKKMSRIFCGTLAISWIRKGNQIEKLLR